MCQIIDPSAVKKQQQHENKQLQHKGKLKDKNSHVLGAENAHWNGLKDGIEPSSDRVSD